MDARTLHYYIPNDPSPKTKQQSNGKRKKSSEHNKNLIVNNENNDQNNVSNDKKEDDNSILKKNTVKEDIDIQSPISSPTKKYNNDTISNDNNARFHSRLWKSFFASVTRSVDELYYLCEEEGDEQKVQEAVELFERSVHDFVKLIERIQEQRRFSLDQTTAISWEVRKPTVSRNTRTFSPGSPNALQLMSVIKASPQSIVKTNNDNDIISNNDNNDIISNNDKQNIDTDCIDNENKNRNSKLRAAAPIFLPASNKSTGNEILISNDSIGSKAVPANAINHHADKNNKENLYNNTKLKTYDNQNVLSNNSAFSSIDDWDAEAEAEVVLASEQIWAEAEAWIEAEAAVEEAAWEVLGFDDNKNNNNNSNDTNQSIPIDSIVRPISKDFIYREEIRYEKENNDSISIDNSNYNSDNENENDNDIVKTDNINENDDETNSKADKQNTSYRYKTPIFLNSQNNSYGTPDYTDDNISKSPSQQNINLTPTSRSLHDKLSSPCRRRSLTPVEAKLKAEARQLAAEAHRGGIVQERIEKAKLTWSRIKMRGEKEAQRLAQLEHALEEKLKEAEKRHEEYIKNIKGKAGNENAKVSEVMFINSLNSDMVAEHLQQKFEEVEARVLAAAQRRQERLDAISNQKMRRNSRKTVQMSELRLRLEQIKMERWSNLQKRLDAVNQRRLSRLAEMKRRSDEESSKPTLLSTNDNPTDVLENMQLKTDTKDINKITTILEEESISGKVVLENSNPVNINNDIAEAHLEFSKAKANKSVAAASIQRVLIWNFWNTWYAQIKKKGTANSRNAAISKQWEDICHSLHNRQDTTNKSTISSFISEMLNDAVVWLDSNLNAAENKSSNQSKKKKNTKTNATFISQNIEKFHDILSTIYKLKNKKEAILDFTTDNGLIFLRIFLGTELGLLRSEESLSAGVKCSIWPNIGRLLVDIGASALGRDKLLQSGVGVLISDYIHISLLHLLSWRQNKFQPMDTDEYFGSNDPSNVSNDKKKKKNGNKKSSSMNVIENPNNDSNITSKNKSKNAINNTSDINKSWPQEFLILPHLLTVVTLLFRHIPSDDTFTADYQDKLIWYFFASGTLNLICRCLVDLQQLTNEVTELDLPYAYANSMLGLISALASFLRLSAGVSPSTMLTSISSLSSKVHKHPRGREMVSLLRAADMIPSIISLLGSFILSKRNACSVELTSPVYSLTLTILQSLIELATVDLSLLQELPQDSQVSIIHCASHLMQSLLVTQNRSDSDDFSYLLSAANVISNDGFIINDQSVRDILKPNDKHDTIKFSVVEADLCLDRLFSFLGLICLRSPCMQAVISRGTTPTLLIELCRLPIRYFTEERLKRQLLPCLISICLDSPDNLNVLKIELSCSILASFLKDSQQQLLHFEDKKNEGEKVSTYLCQLSHRLPLDLWDIAITTFEQMKIQKTYQKNNNQNSNFQKALLSVD